MAILAGATSSPRPSVARTDSVASNDSSGSVVRNFPEDADGLGSVVIRSGEKSQAAPQRDSALHAVRQQSYFCVETLRQLILSPSEGSWRQGVSWLFQLRHAIAVAEKELASSAQFQDSPFQVIDSVLDQLVDSLLGPGLPPATRLAYLSVVEATLVWMRGNSASPRDQITFVNAAVGRLVQSNQDSKDREKTEVVLMKMFDIVFSLISVVDNSSKICSNSDIADAYVAASADFILSNQALDDSAACLFLTGHVAASLSQLKQIDISILHYIFVNLPPRYTCQMRAALLHLLIERCRRFSEEIDTIGGTGFFKKLLNENDPQISYLASRFLIDKLQREKPEQFADIINTLLARAVEAYDEKLVSNPYLQIKAILEMQDTVGPRNRSTFYAQTAM